MSTTTIHCSKCRTALADKRPAGTIKLRPGVLVVRLIVGGGDAVCPTCGRVTTLTVALRKAA